MKNAVINARSSFLRDKRRQTGASLDDSGVAARSESEPATDELVQGFKRHVRSALGDQAEQFLQHLLDGGEKKDLVKRKVLTSYRAKELVKGIKRELLSFGANDRDFLEKVKRAIAGEERSLNQRFGANRRQAMGE